MDLKWHHQRSIRFQLPPPPISEYYIFIMAALVSLESCSYCGANNPNLKACSKCRVTKYCGRECQLADWKAGHKKVCGEATKASDEATLSASSEGVLPSSLETVWPDEFTKCSTNYAKRAHALKWKGGAMSAFKSGSFSHSPIYRNALQPAIANPTADWPKTVRGAKNNRLDLLHAIVEKLTVLLEFFYVHAAHKSGSKKKGALLIEADTMLLDDLVCRDASQHLIRPVAVHYLTQKELVQYFVDFCSSSDNAAEATAKQLLDTCKLEDPMHVTYFTIVIAMKHQLDKAGEGISHCHSILSIPNGSFDHESHVAAIETMNSIYSESDGLSEAQVIEVDLVSGDVTAFDLKQKKSSSMVSASGGRGAQESVSAFAKSLA
jgi:hypothetical protein